eukprot:scaffold2835_cov105-Isochrysis_galbana.AAC.10
MRPPECGRHFVAEAVNVSGTRLGVSGACPDGSCGELGAPPPAGLRRAYSLHYSPGQKVRTNRGAEGREEENGLAGGGLTRHRFPLSESPQ